ncbi:membrane-bound lytic murein transglycosylase F [Microbulbifer yueqingensis]|uniref:Membrane-bound lytic murein transglycosylase F n=1 Tax=Microbulbifer yueqingensis TaxID=658219 RepID=A0A1G8UYM8_9GAMM|nr:membrane-bound lytic murein transglycosylase F [Microbulbifer yueqingensis]
MVTDKTALRRTAHSCAVVFCVLLACLALSSCDRGEPGQGTPVGEQPGLAPATGGTTAPREQREDRAAAREDETVQKTEYIEKGDLAALKKRGIIRFVSLTADDQQYLPRKAIVTQTHRQLANRLAERLKLQGRWMIARTPEEALQMVAEGRADVFADNVSDTEQRREIVSFTIPLLQTPDVLVSGKKGPDISDPKNLRGTELIVLAGSSYADRARELVKKYPDANLSVREVYLVDERDTLFDLVSKGDNAVTILHKNIAEDTLQYRDDLKIGAVITEPEDIAWAVRQDAKQLRTRINNFLTRTLVTSVPERTSHWYAIKKSGVLRFATYNGPLSYYLWRGVLRGFDYEMALAFAEKHDLALKIVVVPNEEDLVDWVVDGRADIAGASTTITRARMEKGVQFSVPFLETPQRIVTNRNKPPIETLGDLAGRTLTLRAYSSFIETARVLQKNGVDVEIDVAPPDMSFATILNKVAEGEFDATIEDAYIAEIQAALRPDLDIGMQVSDPLPQGWMVKQGHKDLLKQVNRFMEKFAGSDEYKKLFAAYFKPDKHLVQKINARVVPGEDLSPYDKLVKKNSLERDFDWRLITAQMWQESNFNPKATSPVGAQGLLQVMPRTGEDMGYPPPLYDPDKNLQAGVKYMEWVRNRFKDPLPEDEKLWFTLASYNAGLGHVQDAQILAEELGLDPTKWFDNVEVAMLKLEQPEYFEKARYGYARGAEPVAYVRKISKLYEAYTNMATGDVAMGQARAGGSPPAAATLSGRSCRYGCWTPSACGPQLPAAMQTSPLSAGAPCPPQPAAIPFVPGRWLWPPSPPLSGGAE